MSALISVTLTKKKKGSSSVFLVMVLGTMITLALAFVSAALRVGAIGYIDGVMNLSARSVLSEFDTHLKDDYGLFAFRGHKQEIISKMTDYLSYTLDHNKYMDLESVDANTAGYSLADIEIFEDELIEYTKYAIARGIIGDLTAAGGTGQAGDFSSGHGSWAQGGQYVNGASGSHHYSYGSIDTEKEGRTLRNHKIIDQLPSGAHPGSGSITDKIKEVLEGTDNILLKGTDSYAVVQYIMHTFKNAQQGNERDTFFNNEAEYIIEGEMSDLKNRKELRKDIITVRNAVNFLFIWGNDKMRNEVMAAGELLGADIGTLPMALLISEGWALAEAENDMRLLEHGRKVPVYKTTDVWAIDIQSIIDNKESGYIDTDPGSGLNYQGYLQMFLFLEERALRMSRIMDLIQINIQGKYDRSFLIKEHNMGFWVKAEADGREYAYDHKY